MSRKLKVGLFVGGTMFVLAVFILLVGDVAYLFNRAGYTLNVDVPSAAGLDSKAVVKMAGVKIGFVRDIRLAGIRARVIISVESNVNVPVDSTATFSTLGLLGEKYVEITPGKSSEFCRDGAVIQGAMSIGFDQIGGLLSSLGGEIQAAAASLRGTLDEEMRTKLKAALDGAAGAAGELRAFLAQNKGGVENLVQGASRTVDGIGRTATEAAADLEKTLALLRETVQENRDGLKADLAIIRDAVEKLRSILDRIDRGEGTAGKLIREPGLYDEARQALTSVQNTTRSLSAVKGYVDFQAGYYGSSELVRAGLSAGLRPSEKSFFEAGLIRDPWEAKFKFSLQGGWRFGRFVSRVGFIENELGVGMDYLGTGDRWGLSLEGFDFNRPESPRVRLTARIYPDRRFYLLAGADDFALSRKREFFFGFGVSLR
jgi:phospholipid/cholesterol/gamma-HCH transport system substrate-binding protein